MVDCTESDTVRREDYNPKEERRTTPQYIYYLKKGYKRKDSKSPNNIIEELNEEGLDGDSGNNANFINKKMMQLWKHCSQVFLKS